MKSFNTVYNTEKKNVINERKSVIDNDHARLLAAIKKEYGINDFSRLSESKKVMLKRVINEMWSPSNGLTDKGRAFISESQKPLTEASSAADVEKRVKRSIKANAEKILQDVVDGRGSRILAEIKSSVEEEISKKIAKNMFVKWVGEVICPVLGQKVKSIKF